MIGWAILLLLVAICVWCIRRDAPELFMGYFMMAALLLVLLIARAVGH